MSFFDSSNNDDGEISTRRIFSSRDDDDSPSSDKFGLFGAKSKSSNELVAAAAVAMSEYARDANSVDALPCLEGEEMNVSEEVSGVSTQQWSKSLESQNPSTSSIGSTSSTSSTGPVNFSDLTGSTEPIHDSKSKNRSSPTTILTTSIKKSKSSRMSATRRVNFAPAIVMKTNASRNENSGAARDAQSVHEEHPFLQEIASKSTETSKATDEMEVVASLSETESGQESNSTSSFQYIPQSYRDIDITDSMVGVNEIERFRERVNDEGTSRTRVESSSGGGSDGVMSIHTVAEEEKENVDPQLLPVKESSSSADFRLMDKFMNLDKKITAIDERLKVFKNRLLKCREDFVSRRSASCLEVRMIICNADPLHVLLRYFNVLKAQKELEASLAARKAAFGTK